MRTIVKEPSISVILPAFNERERIAQAIESLQKQTYSRWRATVVANACTDDTASVVRGFNSTNVDVIETPNQGISLAKNLGYRAEKPAKELFVFMDSDCVAKGNLLETVVARINQGYEGGKAAVRAFDDDRLRASLFFAWQHALHRICMHIPGIDSGGGCFTFLTQDLASKIEFKDGGIFDERLQVMEDIDIMTRMKAAGPCTFVDDSHVLTSMRRFKEEGYLKCMLEDAIHGISPLGKTRKRWQIPEEK